MNNSAVHQKEFDVRSYEIDHFGNIRLTTIQKYFQEIAWEHAKLLNVSYKDLISRNMIWILHDIRIKIFRFQRWQERVWIHTWPSGVNRLHALRDFEVFDKEGKLTVAATSSWFILNLESKHPVPPLSIIEHVRIGDRRALPGSGEKYSQPVTISHKKVFPVRVHDLDIHQHVNNISFMEWCLETMPFSYWNEFELQEFAIKFRAEAFYGEEVLSEIETISKPGGVQVIHRLSRVEDGRELARALSFWSARMAPLHPEKFD